jgi:hypothetical protein
LSIFQFQNHQIINTNNTHEKVALKEELRDQVIQEAEVHTAPCKVGNKQITLSTLDLKVLTSLRNYTKPLEQTHHEIMSIQC